MKLKFLFFGAIILSAIGVLYSNPGTVLAAPYYEENLAITAGESGAGYDTTPTGPTITSIIGKGLGAALAMM